MSFVSLFGVTFPFLVVDASGEVVGFFTGDDAALDVGVEDDGFASFFTTSGVLGVDFVCNWFFAFFA